MNINDSQLKKLKAAILNEVFVTKETHIIDQGNWLFDFRNIFLEPEHIDTIADIFWDLYEEEYPFQVGGQELAAIPLVTAIVMKGVERGKKVSGFFIRKSRKKTGLAKLVEGQLNDNKVILVDDLINSGNTLQRQVAILEKCDKTVAHIFTLIAFRTQNAYIFTREKNITLQSLFTLEDFDKKPLDTLPHKKIPKQPFKIDWCFKSKNPNYFYVIPKSTPVLDNSKVYFGSDSGNFWALNQEDGSVAWKYKVGWHAKGKSIFSAPALHEDTVYFGSYDGNVYALNTQTGKKKWIFFEADWVGSSPVVATEVNTLFIGLEFGLWKKHGGIVALDLETGKKKWEYTMSEYTHGSPTYLPSKKIVAIGSNDSKMYLFNAKNGKLLWEFQAGGKIKASPIFDEKRNHVLFGSHDGNLYILDIKTGNLIFKYQTKFAIYSTPIIYNNSVYFSSLDKHLYSLDLDTHKLNWTFRTSGRVFASPEVIKNNIYIGSNDGRLYEVDSETGKELSFFQATERITNKIVYNPKTKKYFLLTFANELYCLTKNFSP